MTVTTRTETTDRRKIRGAWLLPTFAFAFGGGFGEQHVMQGVDAFTVLATGIVAGLLWQVLNRRDLADRLTLLAVCTVFGAGFLALVPSGSLLANAGPGHALAGIVAGAVLCERLMRLRAKG